MRDLRARGFAVATLDWRGQGMSDRALRNPRKGYVRNFAEYQIDLETFVNEVVLPDCPPPVFALAHSMGATVLLRAAYAGHRWFDRMVLLAPMIALPGMRRSLGDPHDWSGPCARWGSAALYVPGGDATVMMQRPFVGNLLTSDPVRYARNVAVLEAEPALAIGWPTVAWTDSAFRVMGEICRAELSRPHPPADPDHRRRPRRHRLDAGDRRIRGAAARRLASHRAGRAPRAADGAGPLPRPGVRRVRRLRAGHAAVRVNAVDEFENAADAARGATRVLQEISAARATN